MKQFLVTASIALSVLASNAATQTFKMYEKPFAKPDASCDIHTVLTLEINGNTAVAKVRDALSGMCEIYIPANPRSYTLQLEGDDGCGSKNWSGFNVKLTDNRGRRCENVIPGLIVFEEAGRTLYSKDY